MGLEKEQENTLSALKPDIAWIAARGQVAPYRPQGSVGLDSRVKALATIRQPGQWSGALQSSLRTEWQFGHFFHFVPALLGLGAVTWFASAVPPGASTIIALLSISIILLVLVDHHAVLLRAMLWAVLLFALGLAAAAWETRRLSTVILDQALVTQITGVVERREAGSGQEWRYIIRLTSTKEPTIRRPPERISLLARSSPQPVQIGGQISGRARLSPPSGSALPQLNDFAFASYYQGVGAVGFFLGAPTAVALPAELPEADLFLRFDRALFTLRDHISTRIRTIIPGDPGAFAAAIITGERRSMSKEATEALRLSGLAHITAISGLNMALAAGIFFVGLRSVLSLFPTIAQSYPVKKLAAFGALLAITGYLMISGYQVSAVRAYLMTGIMLVAVLLDRPALSLRNLAIAGAIIIILTPSAVMGPSFQMSFAATAALIAGYNMWQRRSHNQARRKPNRLWKLLTTSGGFIGGILLTSLIGGASTAIFSVYHFHRLALHGLEANLAAMPLISMVVMPAGFLGMLLMPFGLDRPFFVVMGLGLQLVLAVAHEVASWGEGVSFMRQPDWFLPLSIFGFLLLTLLKTRLRFIGAAIMALTIGTTWTRPEPRHPDLVISEDGEIAAIWSGYEALATNRTKPSAFLFDQWRPSLGVKTHVAPEIVAKAPEPQTPNASGRGLTYSQGQLQQVQRGAKEHLSRPAPDRFTCYATICIAEPAPGWRIATVQRPEFISIACDIADVVISPTRWRYLECRKATRLLTANQLKQTGSLEIVLNDPTTKTWTVTQAFEGPPKPWTLHRLYDWRSAEFARVHVPLDSLNPWTRNNPVRPRNDADKGEATFEINDSGE